MAHVFEETDEGVEENETSQCCSICLEEIRGSDEDGYKLDSCQHCFHPRCLIGWMRQGHLSCPICRGDMHRASAEELPCLTLYTRAKYLRMISRRTTAPLELKRLVKRIRDAETKHRESQHAFTQYRREHRDIMKQYNSLRMKTFTANRRVRELNRLLGMFQCEGMRLPALQIHRHEY